MGTITAIATQAAVIAAPVAPDVDAISGFNGSLIQSFLLGLILLVVALVALKMLLKSDRTKVKDTAEYAGNTVIVFLVLVLVTGGLLWTFSGSALDSILG